LHLINAKHTLFHDAYIYILFCYKQKLAYYASVNTFQKIKIE
jgi:hypothetical protein